MAESRLDQLSARGQSVWIDYLSRDLLETGELKRMMKEDAVVGVTSNPTIFQKALSQGGAYDEQLKELEHQGDAKEIFLHLAVATSSRRSTCSRRARAERPGRLRLDRGRPNLAYDEGDVRRGDPPARVDRPAQPLREDPRHEAGPKAIEDCIAAGRSINVTLAVLVEMHSESMEGYLRGLERFVEGGGDATKVRSVAASSSHAWTPRPTSGWRRSA
jgi:transaldolase